MPPEDMGEIDDIEDIMSMGEPALGESEDVEATDIALDSLVGDMFAAIEVKDRDSFKRALRDAFEMFAAEAPDIGVAELEMPEPSI